MRTLSRYRKINYNHKPVAETGSLKSYWRLYFVKYVFWCVALGLFLRLIQIQIFDSKKYEKLAQEQYIREYTQKAPRGLIYDRNMVTLAINKLQYSLGVDKRAVKNVKELSSKLASILKKNTNYLTHKLENESGFVQIERKLGEEEAKIIDTMKLPGVKITTDAKRHYLFKTRLAQVLGFIDVDGKGISGIELKYDAQLQGQDGWRILQKDAKGKTIMPIQDLVRESEKGDDIILTIDNVIQAIVEDELDKTVVLHNAKGGMAIVTNPATGEILAMASVPGFDANDATKTKPEAWRIRGITDIYEPGSTFKVVTMMVALSENMMGFNDKIFCENGKYKIFGELINDTEKHGTLTFKDVFKYSSNIGAAKIALKIGKEKIFKAARDFGFGNPTGIDLPGEVSGILKNPAEWSGFTLASISYGHEIAVTSLQMAMAYGAIANGGMLMKPAVIKEIISATHSNYTFKPVVIRQVMDPIIAQKMTSILKEVVEDGTGINAKIPGLSIAGKTGTAQKPLVGENGYSNSKYVASFVGYYPADQAQLLIYVTINEPYPVHSGGSVAAPAVKKMLEKILQTHKNPKTIQKEEIKFTQSETPGENKNIPDFVGRGFETADKILKEQNLKYKLEGDGSIVKKQQVTTDDDNEQIITMTLGSSDIQSKYHRMPDLVGVSLRKAIAELSQRGLEMKIDGYGQVVHQQPQPGEKIKAGARCYLECRPATPVSLLLN